MFRVKVDQKFGINTPAKVPLKTFIHKLTPQSLENIPNFLNELYPFDRRQSYWRERTKLIRPHLNAIDEHSIKRQPIY